MAVWIVRGGDKQGDAEQHFLKSESVGIHFEANQSIVGMSEAELRREIQRSYEEWKPGVNNPKGPVTYYLNQLLKFRDDIQLGDTIIMPRKAARGHRVALGIVVSGYEYWGSADYPHRRRVGWTERESPTVDLGDGYVKLEIEGLECSWYTPNRLTVFRVDGG